MLRSKNIDMVNGPLFSGIMKFAFPFMIMGIFQKLYNAADIIVAGRYAGQETLAGVGTTSVLVDFGLNFVIGLSVGVNVILGRALGAKNKADAQKTVHTAMLLSVICGFIVTFICYFFAKPLLKMIDVPENVMPQAELYMKICAFGNIPSMIYNFGAAILRAKGDTKKAMYIVFISGIINVVLNVFFVVKLGMKADGVALATVISQLFTAVCIVYILCREKNDIKLSFSKLRISIKHLKGIIRVGIPSGIQSSVFSFANLIVQSSVNSFGSAAIAGSAAATNIGSFYQIALNAFYQASVAFASQNIGANKYDRIKKIVLCCLAGVSGLWIFEIILTVFAGEFMVSIYAPGNIEAISKGVKKLNIVGNCYGICGFMNVMCGTLRGMDRSFHSMVASIIGVCGIRIVWIMTVFKIFPSFESLFISFPLSWLGTFIMHSILFSIEYKKMKKHII